MEVSPRELGDAMTHLAADFSIGASGHPTEADIEHAALSMLRSPLPAPYTRDEDELGRTFFYNASTGRSEWRHPLEGYYRGWLFMNKARGLERTHERMKEAPETPEELREMAEFLKVDVRKEFPLLQSVREALHAPLPFGWKEVHETNARERYVHNETKNGSVEHPLDAYFRERISRKRKEARAHSRASSAVSQLSKSLMMSHLDVSRRSVPPPWMEFVEPCGGATGTSSSPGTANAGDGGHTSSSALGGLYWFNFTTNECSYVHPAQVSAQVERRRCAVLLQALARGRLERKKLHKVKLQRAVQTIETAWLVSRSRLLQRPRSSLAASASSPVPGPNFAQMRRDAATTIQRFWRGFSARKHLKDEDQLRRIIRVQSVWRGGRCRSQVRSFLAAGKRGLDAGTNIVADGVAQGRKRMQKLARLCDDLMEIALVAMS